MPFVIHSLVQSIGKRMFLNNIGLLAELEGSTDIHWKERISLVKEFVVGMILKCKTYKIQEMVDESLGRIHLNETTRGRIRTEALVTSGGKHNGNVVVAWMLGC